MYQIAMKMSQSSVQVWVHPDRIIEAAQLLDRGRLGNCIAAASGDFVIIDVSYDDGNESDLAFIGQITGLDHKR